MRKEKLEELENYISEFKTVEIMNEKEVSKGFLTIMQADYRLSNGKVIKRDRVLKNGHEGDAVIVMPITKEGNVILVVQSRVCTESTVGVEVPAGLIDANEDPKEAAIRELREETGYEAKKYINLLEYYQSEGNCKGKNYCYLAIDCEKKYNQDLDEDEFIKYYECSVDEVYELMDMGYIRGAASIIALERARKYLKK